MFKRLFWLVVGVGFGFGSSFWLMRAARRTAQRLSPQRMSVDVAAGARALRADVRAAVAEGRDAVRDDRSDAGRKIGPRQ